MAEFKPVKKAETPQGQEEFKPVAKARKTKLGNVVEASPYLKLFDFLGQPIIEGLGLVGGGIAGSAVFPPFGPVAGAALGFGIGKKTGEMARRSLAMSLGEKVSDELPIADELMRSAEDIKTGAMMEMGGQATGKILEKGATALGKAGLQAFGKLTGTGVGAPEQAVRSGRMNIGRNPLPSKTTFDKAMRGELKAQEVVDMAQAALAGIKDARAIKYQAQLKNIQNIGTGGSAQINPTPIVQDLSNLAQQYRISIAVKDGKYIVDTSKAALGKAGREDIKEIIKEVGEWDDFTPLGLDALKRRIGDLYSDSSQARQFITSLEKSIKKTITEAVPEYSKMVKDYEVATRLIKDIESNLMMRKQGMSGRIVSDQTLRRLVSAMKENFELRRNLVDAMTINADDDVMGAIAGYAMSQYMPRGITGTGAAIVGSLYAAAINPKFWPLVMSSSPRVAGEFLRLVGKYTEGRGAMQAIGRATAYGLLEGKEAGVNQ